MKLLIFNDKYLQNIKFVLLSKAYELFVGGFDINI